MIKWWSTITYIGNWDIVNGVEKNKTLFERIDCNPKSQSEMICGGAVLNVNSGSISNGNQLDSLVISQDGKMIRRMDLEFIIIRIRGKNMKDIFKMGLDMDKELFIILIMTSKI